MNDVQFVLLVSSDFDRSFASRQDLCLEIYGNANLWILFQFARASELFQIHNYLVDIGKI